MTKHHHRLASALALAVFGLWAVAAPAAADPIGAGQASAFGGTIAIAGQEAVPPTPTATAQLPGDDADTAVDLPADPVAVSGTLNASASVHVEADLDSALGVATQAVAGPYNAVAVGSVEEAEVLVDVVGEGVSLVSAGVLRAEAVGVCVGDAVQYSATSEIIDLDVGGEQIPLNAPLEQILDAIGDVLEQTTLDQVVDIDRNVVTELEDGIAVDALVVTVLSVAGDPVAEVRLGHAEVSGVACGAALPKCSDGIDNDGDGLIDFPDDPGCDSPEDDSELDERDDAALPGAPSAGPDPGLAVRTLPETGGDAATTAAIAAALAAGAMGLLALRRRLDS